MKGRVLAIVNGGRFNGIVRRARSQASRSRGMRNVSLASVVSMVSGLKERSLVAKREAGRRVRRESFAEDRERAEQSAEKGRSVRFARGQRVSGHLHRDARADVRNARDSARFVRDVKRVNVHGAKVSARFVHVQTAKDPLGRDVRLDVHRARGNARFVHGVKRVNVRGVKVNGRFVRVVKMEISLRERGRGSLHGHAGSGREKSAGSGLVEEDLALAGQEASRFLARSGSSVIKSLATRKA